MGERMVERVGKKQFTKRTTFIIPKSITGKDPAKQFSDAIWGITRNGTSLVHNSVNGFHQWAFIRKKKKVEVTFDGKFFTVDRAEKFSANEVDLVVAKVEQML